MAPRPLRAPGGSVRGAGDAVARHRGAENSLLSEHDPGGGADPALVTRLDAPRRIWSGVVGVAPQTPPQIWRKLLSLGYTKHILL